MNTLLDAELEPEIIARIWCSIFQEDERMTALLRRLKGRYRTFILSDTDPLHWDWLNRNYGVEEWATGNILSFRQVRMKADPGAFAEIIRSFCLPAANTVFVDDLEKNIAAAEAAGLRGVLHKGYEETLKSLEANGVMV
ncbi:MAG: HAD family hydrolase [Fibrobacterota bacterium]